MRAGGQCRSRRERVSTWTDDDAARPFDVGRGRERDACVASEWWSVLVAACSSGSGSPAPSGAAASYALRATTQQAIPPESQFPLLPYALITDDGISITQGAVPAIFPGPLVAPLFGAQLSESGYERIVERARSLGLLDGTGDFRPPNPMPGSLTGVVELTVDGAIRELTGDPNANIECITTPCDAAPGTSEAFGSFWRELGDLRSMVGDELGAETAYHPEGYALLIGVTPPNDAGLAPQMLPWPLETTLAETGVPIGDGAVPRCATVGGDDAATLEAAFAGANQLTLWGDAGADSADAVSIAVRPLLPGDDPCMDLFGVNA